MKITRLLDAPIIRPDMDGHMGSNINGPSLIRTPDWLPGRLGRYYLYFGHHQGKYIRLAYADDLAGPWRTHEPGTLQLAQTPFPQHIASPDVHVDEANRRLVMFFHGCCRGNRPIPWNQYTCVAFSGDGLAFESRDEPLCQSYLRMFIWRGRHYGLAMPGQLYRSFDGLTAFEPGPMLIGKQARHFAVKVIGDTLHLFYSIKGDCPEHIVCASVPMSDDDWNNWRASKPESVLQPERDWEGVNAPHVPSVMGAIHQPAYQLRDPAIFDDQDGQTYLIYSVAGESGLGIARVDLPG